MLSNLAVIQSRCCRLDDLEETADVVCLDGRPTGIHHLCLVFANWSIKHHISKKPSQIGLYCNKKIELRDMALFFYISWVRTLYMQLRKELLR